MKQALAMIATCVALAGCSFPGDDTTLIGTFANGQAYLHASAKSVSIDNGCGTSIAIPHFISINPDGSFSASGIVVAYSSSRDTISISGGGIEATVIGTLTGDQITLTVAATVYGRALQVLTFTAPRVADIPPGGICRL